MEKGLSAGAVRPAARTHAATEKFFRVGWPAIVFALYLSAGAFKADPRMSWIPVDLTVVCAVLLFAMTFVTYAVWKPPITPTIVWVLAFYFVIAMSGLYTIWTSYALLKYQRFITLTLLSSMIPFFLFSDWREIRKLLNAILIVGVVITIDALELFVKNAGHWGAESRLTAASMNTIELGRYTGMVGIYIVLYAAERSAVKFGLAIAAVLVIIALMLGSGSRGPIVGVIVALALTFFIFYRNNVKVVLRTLVLVTVLAVLIPVGSELLPGRSVQRVAMFFSSDPMAQSHENTSVLMRSHAISVALQRTMVNPLGMGMGGFERITRARTQTLVYPHNIILELFMENGWIAGGIFLAIVAASIKQSAFIALGSGALAAKLVFCLTIYFFINSLVSGDLNDNRFLFAFLSMTLAAYRGGSRTEDTR